MASSFSSGCVIFNAEATSPSLLELLPKNARSLAPPLSMEDSEILNYLLLIGLHIQLLKGAAASSRTLWRPWKSNSTSSSFSNTNRNHEHDSSFDSSSANGNPRSVCDCFGCYSSFWRRWDASPNRDLINKILDMVEMQDKGLKPSKGSTKKKKKNQTEKNTVSTTDSKINVNVETLNVSDKDHCDHSAARKMDLSFTESSSKITATSDLVVATDSTSKLSKLSRRQARKAMDSKKKEPFSITEVKKGECVPGVLTEASSRVPEKVDAEVPNLPLTLAPIKSQQQRTSATTTKRKSNQIMPLDCECVEVVHDAGLEEDMDMTSSLSPRLADTNLRSRGFLARVFPDALGGVASRLWDLVSFRLRSHSMDYY